MKKLFFLLLIGLVIYLFSFFKKPVKSSISTYVKSFISYINQQPVFDSYAEKTRYVIKEKLEVLTRYPGNYPLNNQVKPVIGR